MEQKTLSVSEVNRYIQTIMDNDFLLSGVVIRGEISTYKVYPSGHHYFTIKDDQSALKCVMFRSSAIKVKFKPEAGMQVIALGKIS
ncbi:MAG: exodeoxyribonuclease VII large subunit, partial [Oscillospiraceae bacterium]|nr:exodeoxyribonuclease VII large subunit [Oscillospiraceae bacterium]